MGRRFLPWDEVSARQMWVAGKVEAPSGLGAGTRLLRFGRVEVFGAGGVAGGQATK